MYSQQTPMKVHVKHPVKASSDHNTPNGDSALIHSNPNESKLIKPKIHAKPVTSIPVPVNNKQIVATNKLPIMANSPNILTPAEMNPSIESNLNTSKVEYFEISNIPRPDLKVVNNLKLPAALPIQ